jgi:hypothetical protein
VLNPATPTEYHLDQRRERLRRLRILLLVVPALLDRHLKPLLGWRRFPFVLGLLFGAPAYGRRFARHGDDAGLKEVKRTFLLVGALYDRLKGRFGEARALAVGKAFLFDLANAVQRQAYLPSPPHPRDWDWFHQEHEAQMREGFIRNNENDGVFHIEREVKLDIVRCRFFEAFRDMGNAALTEAFCRSDEVVFNEYSPAMRFHRGEKKPDTIARGAKRCRFVYERLD